MCKIQKNVLKIVNYILILALKYLQFLCYEISRKHCIITKKEYQLHYQVLFSQIFIGMKDCVQRRLHRIQFTSPQGVPILYDDLLVLCTLYLINPCWTKIVLKRIRYFVMTRYTTFSFIRKMVSIIVNLQCWVNDFVDVFA